MSCSICFQVSKKKKKKKSKVDGNDSGVEVYFREEDDDDDDAKKTQSGSIKVSDFLHFNFLLQNAENRINFSQQEAQSSTGLSRLQVATGFSWDVGLNSLKPLSAVQESESSDEEEPDKSNKVKQIETFCWDTFQHLWCVYWSITWNFSISTIVQAQKKSRHELEQDKKAAEKALMQREAELMDPNLQPEDAAAFERLLLASPNSSLLWLQYMAHHLQATQIEQARAVAERALKTISFRWVKTSNKHV